MVSTLADTGAHSNEMDRKKIRCWLFVRMTHFLYHNLGC